MAKKVAVLISGNGTNLQALIDVCKKESYPAEISLVISNNPNAYGLKRAQAAKIPTVVINHKDYPSRENFDTKIDAALREHKIRFVCLAGFMRMLSSKFVTKWEGKMINIHPSLLPDFKGANAHADVLAAGNVRESGCTVHFVIPEMDAGPIIEQSRVPVLPDDTIETLAARVREKEHDIYPKALAQLVNGDIRF